MPLTPCPDENLLSAWAFGAATVDEARALSEHVEGCDRCREAFSALATAGDLPHAVDALADTTPSAAPASELVGERPPVEVGDVLLGKYEVEAVLGSGGMGVVVRARHRQLNTRIALKFVRAELARDKDIVARFSREARAAVRLKTEHVCKVLDLGVLPSGLPFMAMEYLEGESLDALLEREGPQPPERAVAWIRQVLEGLAEAHALGIVHRDLKPANLFLTRGADGSETIKILDFGIAKSVHPDIEAGLGQTSQRVLIGSPAWMSPEQLSASPVDARSDLWAVGATLYALLTGAPPFSGGDFVQLAWRIRTVPAADLPAHVPPAVNAVVMRCLAKSPEDRFQSVEALAAALLGRAEGGGRRAEATVRRRWVVPVGFALAAVVGLSLPFALSGAEGPAVPPPPVARSAEPAPIPAAEPAPSPVPHAVAPTAPAPDPGGLPTAVEPVRKAPKTRAAKKAGPTPDSGQGDEVFGDRL